MNRNLSHKKDKSRSLRKLFVLVMVMALTLPSFSQITVNVRNKTLRQALSEIEKVSDFRFFYNESLAILDKNSSIRVTNGNIDDVMQRLLAGTNVTYEKNNNIIALVGKADVGQAPASAQQNKVTVTGRITDTQGEPIIGANIIEEGVSGNGTVTDYDGRFTLSVTRNATLKISYLGYGDIVLSTSGRTSFNITMEEDTEVLREVVVTALGIKREQKALGYSVQEISGESLQKVSGVDVGTSLTGKVAGLLVKNPTDFATTPNITVRGENPLLVIDGIAYVNKTLSDISSEDIESMSVLKGATASALYGFRGASGAILITTKNGSESNDGVNVDFTTNTMFTAGFLAIPEKQGMYGRGTNNTYDKNSDSSWGTVMDGTIRNQWDPFLMEYADYEYLPVGKDNFKNFLEQGYVTNNNMNVTYKTDKAALRSSLNWVQNKGQYPNSKLNQYTYTFGGDINLGKFQLSSNLSYAKRMTPNMGSNGYTSYDPMYSLLIWSAADFNLMDYKNNYWLKKDQVQNYTYRWGPNNPYFDRYERTNEVSRDIFNADVSVSCQLAEWLKATARSGLDFYTNQGKQRVSWGSYTSMGNTGFPGNQWPWNGAWTGAYNSGQTQGFSINSDLLLTGDKSFGLFGLEYLAGGTIFYKKDETIWGQTVGGISVPAYFSLKASVNPATVGQTRYTQQVNSLYGRLALSWNRMLYLDVTGRNDWSSTLSATQRSYFYPSISGSFVLSELMPQTKDWLDLLKVRSSWTQTKDMAGIYEINSTYNVVSSTWGALNGAKAPSRLYPNDITPSGAKTREMGLQAMMFKNRLMADVSYYRKEMYLGIITGPLSPATGYTGVLINTNERTERKGWEATLNATPVKNAEWQWNVGLNWSKFARYYTQLDSVYSQKKPWVKEGNRVDVLDSKDYLRVPETGELIFNNGRLQYSQYPSVFGYRDPDWLWGFNTSLSYKNWTLFMSFDGVVGGITNTRTESYMWQSGGHPESLTPERAQDVADPTTGHFLGKGVKVASGTVTYDQDGNITSDTRVYAPNDVYTSYKQYIIDLHSSSAWGGNGSPADTYSKTFFKMRELSLTYQLPDRYLANWAQSASVSLVGQNVLFWAKDFKYSDPDGGVEDFSDPSVRYLGFNIKLSF